MKHPAPYTDILLPVFAALLPAATHMVLDPFAGTGKVAMLRAWLPGLACYGAEIEAEWSATANAHACLTPRCSATALPYPAATFDAIVTSPTYGNRMADHHEAKDASERHTYRHAIGHALHPANSGAMQWGDAYRAFHLAAWTEARRVLRPGGVLILNCKDHIRAGVLQEVTEWHVKTLLALGFTMTARRAIACPGQRHGANGAARVATETALRFARP
jgi:tRNA G10  N-methylase Trm11